LLQVTKELLVESLHDYRAGYKISTRSSADAERPRDVPQIRNNALEKVCNREMTFKDTQGRLTAGFARTSTYRSKDEKHGKFNLNSLCSLPRVGY